MTTKRQKKKTETLTLRVEPMVKVAAEKAAEHEHRSLTNLIEVLILNYCKEQGIDLDAPKK